MPIDFTTALGRLLSDGRLRALYLRDRAAAVRTLDLQTEDIPAFRALDAEALEAQACSLLDKRFHELGKFLPLTLARLKNEARKVFYKYANEYWPSGHRRHLDEAIVFGEFLQKQRPQYLDQAEFNRLCFCRTGRQRVIHVIRPGFLPAIQVLYRDRRNSPREILFVFGL